MTKGTENAQPKPLRIIKLAIQNVKRIKALAIEPRGHVVEITGANAQGKTSVIDSISLALEGRDAVPVEMLVRRGEERASVELDLGEIVVVKRWTKDGDAKLYVKARTPEGLAELKSPQGVIDRLVGSNSCEPLRFARETPKERKAELMRYVPGASELERLESERVQAFEARTDVNRRIRDTEGALAALPPVEGDDLEVELAASDLLADLQRAQEGNARVEAQQREVARLRRDIEQRQAEVERRRQALAAAERDLAEVAQALSDADELFGTMKVEPIDELRTRLANTEATNRGVRERNHQRTHRKTLQETLARLQRQAQAHTDAIAGLEARKQEALAAAKFPIPGLAVGADDVTLNGVPFTDLAASEQIKVGLALAIAANPRLKIVLVRDGSLLDERSRALLETWAESHDAQVWIETVDSDDEDAWVIEDGGLAREPVGAGAAAGGA